MGGDPPQGGTPATVGPRWPGHRQARPPLWAACRPARGLPWPCRPGNRPAFPPAGGVPPRPAARECAGRRRLRRQCARRSKLPPAAAARGERARAACQRARTAAAGARAPEGRLGARGKAPQREPRGAATPGGECGGRAERHGLRRRRGRAGEAGRSAADRAGGADGPTAPTSWGPGRAGAPTPQPSAGCDRGKARAAARLRAWPCGGHGWPALRLAAGKRRRRADLSRRRCCAAAAAAGG